MPHPFEVAFARSMQFRQSLKGRAPRPGIPAEALEARFGGSAPEQGAPADAIIEALVHAADPGLVASPGRRFFGWIIGAAHEAGVAADWLTSAWGQNAGLNDIKGLAEFILRAWRATQAGDAGSAHGAAAI